jgi:hypothetical protein
MAAAVAADAALKKARQEARAAAAPLRPAPFAKP